MSRVLYEAFVGLAGFGAQLRVSSPKVDGQTLEEWVAGIQLAPAEEVKSSVERLMTPDEEKKWSQYWPKVLGSQNQGVLPDEKGRG